MDLSIQWPADLRADPDVVEVALGTELRRFDAHTRLLLPSTTAPAWGGMPLADGAHVDVHEVKSGDRVVAHRAVFVHDGRAVPDVLSAAEVGGHWWIATAEAVTDVTGDRTFPLPAARGLAPAGDALVVVAEDHLERWVDGRRLCSVPIDARDFVQVAANAEHTLVVTEEGALAVDAGCVVRGAAALPHARWAFDGARVWAWAGDQVRRVRLPDFTVDEAVSDPVADPTWIVGDQRVHYQDGNIDVDGLLGGTHHRAQDTGLSGITAVGAFGDDVAVTDGRTVLVVGGPSWVEPGIVTGIRAVGPGGVVVDERSATVNESESHLVMLGAVPSGNALVGRPLRYSATPVWTLPEVGATAPSPWTFPHPVGTVRCSTLVATVRDTLLAWTFDRPTLVSRVLPHALPVGAGALSTGALPQLDDLHDVGQVDTATLNAGCSRGIGEEAWVVNGGLGTAWASVRDAVRAMEAQSEGWAALPARKPVATWDVPPLSDLTETRRGVLVSSPTGSVMVDAGGVRLRTPGSLAQAGAAWVSHLGPWSLVIDPESSSFRDSIVGHAVSIDDTGALRLESEGTVRVDLGRRRGAIEWGPVVAEGTAVAGWACVRDERSGHQADCARQATAPADPTYGQATWHVDNRHLVVRRGHKVVLERDDIDDVVPAGRHLLVRAHAFDRPWVRYDDRGQPVDVLPPGAVVWGAGGLWVLADEQLDRFDGM